MYYLNFSLLECAIDTGHLLICHRLILTEKSLTSKETNLKVFDIFRFIIKIKNLNSSATNKSFT